MIPRKPNQRMEPVGRSAFRLAPRSDTVGALLLMAHPQRWNNNL